MDKQLHILVIGAHPDDCEEGAGGTAVKYRRDGHIVKFLHATNGDAGHHEERGTDLIARRAEEVRKSCAIHGIQYEILDNHDGYLEVNTLIRDSFIKIIRVFSTDVLITHRPNDYHTDHRNTSVLVQDSSYLLTVPGICPQVKPLTKQPLILYVYDQFKRPYEFTPDIVVDIDNSIEEKVKMLFCHQSQYFEWLPWNDGILDQVPENNDERYKWLSDFWTGYNGKISNQVRAKLIERYGKEQGENVKYTEAFEVSEYGRQLSRERLYDFIP